jgi:hypothetical protein
VTDVPKEHNQRVHTYAQHTQLTTRTTYSRTLQHTTRTTHAHAPCVGGDRLLGAASDDVRRTSGRYGSVCTIMSASRVAVGGGGRERGRVTT